MDLLLLRAVVAEAAARLVEQEVQRVACLGAHRYLLRFSTAAHDNLLVSARPDLSRFHLIVPQTRIIEAAVDPFGAWLDKEIGGAVLTDLSLRAWDRVVDLRLRAPAGGRTLVVELLGRSSNLVLLGPDGTILGHCRDLESAFRAPRTGARYAPPPGREGLAGLAFGPEAVAAIRGRGGDPVAELGRVSPLLIRLASGDASRGSYAADAGAPSGGPPAAPDAAIEAILDRAARGDWAPVVISTRPLEAWSEGDLPGRDDLIASPLPLPGPQPATTAVRCDSPSAAAGTAFGILERLRDFQADREHHAALVRRETRRLETLIGKLEREQAATAVGETSRRHGEALLAGIRGARVSGSVARVPDPRSTDGRAIEIPIDPALSLQQNAQTLFARYKKSKRGAVAIAARLAAARDRLRSWRDLLPAAEAVRDAAGLKRLRESMARLGLVHAPPRRRRPPPGRPAPDQPARVRRHMGPDGLEILVGKSGEENDTLTFRVASPEDFWLHAAGHAGAHVVVRNPRRLKELPVATLRLAAGIAAFYSGARQESKAEVHYTQRKHVHKRRGMPAGQVLLRRFKSIQVAPRLPGSTVEDV
jgi:predicted ribosome quality control (RQC) complex YloA/Tae2 family protein